MRILAVDDDPVFLELLKATLKEIGYDDLTTANCASDALARVRGAQIPYECLLLDVQMPEIDGIELCRLLRQMPAYKSTPILMITAMSQKSYIDRAFAVGATDYVSKPIEAGEMRARIGTIAHLVRKTRETELLENRLQQANEHLGPVFSFDDSILLDDVPGLIGYLALENYILKLGSMGMFANSIVGFHVENAEDMFLASSRQDFLDIMSITAEIIWRSMPGGVVFSYAGGGDFVAIIRRMAWNRREELEEYIRVNMEFPEEIWAAVGCAAPRVKVGNPTNYRLLAVNSPAYMLCQAIDSARNPAASRAAGRFFRLAG